MEYKECVRCGCKMKFLREITIDKKDKNIYRLLCGTEFNEKFKLYVCTSCRSTELFYTGYIEKMN